MIGRRGYRLLRIAAVLALLALVLIVWSFFDTRPIVLVAAMTLGQALGTLSFVAFLVVVLADLRKARLLRDTSHPPPPRRPQTPG